MQPISRSLVAVGLVAAPSLAVVVVVVMAKVAAKAVEGSLWWVKVVVYKGKGKFGLVV